MSIPKQETPKILIVDDDVSIRGVLNEYLINHGCQTYLAKTSDDALDILLSEKIDIVITDINRPSVNGFEFLARMKAFCLADFIVLSGTIPEIITPEQCFDAGASAAMKKPGKLEDILDTVKSLLKKRDKDRT